jgi:hypothetical protein
MEMTGRWGRRCKQLPDDLTGSRGYWKLKLDALDLTMRGTRFGKVCGPLVSLQNGFNDRSAAWMLGELWLGSRLLGKRLSSSPVGAHTSSRRKDIGAVSGGWALDTLSWPLPNARLLNYSSFRWCHSVHRRFIFTWKKNWQNTQRTWG